VNAPDAERYRQVAALHAQCIGDGFLSSLGTPFLAQLYRAIDASPEGLLVVEEADGRIVGFAAGGYGMGPIYRELLRRPVRLFAALLPSLLHPARLWRMLEIVRYGRGGRLPPDLPEAELLSIAVAPGHRGTGCAERLYHALSRQFLARGTRAFRIVVGAGLAPAHRFYLRRGARPVAGLEVHRGAASVVYVQII